LPICKELVQRMGGEIHLESEEGKGTIVEIRLPEVTDG
jgi:signal transduction histidine kinase